jgi:O-antigen ligase
LLYSYILVRLFSIGRRLLSARATLLAFLPLVAYCFASCAWSNDPGITLRRASFLAFSTLIGMILGADFTVTELIRLLAVASLVHIVLCAGFFAVAPHLLYSPSDLTGLKGLTTHKNIFGFLEGVAVLAFLLVPFPKARFLRIPLTAVAFVLLLLSHSSGSLVSTVGALAVLPVLYLFTIRGNYKLPLALVSSVGFVAVTLVIVQNIEAIPALLSKDPTLTGRTQLWQLILVAIGHHPLLGYGFDSFWQGLQGDSLEIISQVGWLVPTAHNGYLDLLLGTGIVGALLMLPSLVLTITRAAHYLLTERSTSRYFPIAFLVLWLIYNLNESALLTRSGLPFLLVTALVTSLGCHKVGRASAVQIRYTAPVDRRPFPGPAVPDLR